MVATGDATLRRNLEQLLDALEECQRASKPPAEGYLSAFPEELIDRFEKQELVWAPYYTVHKIIQARTRWDGGAAGRERERDSIFFVLRSGGRLAHVSLLLSLPPPFCGQGLTDVYEHMGTKKALDMARGRSFISSLTPLRCSSLAGAGSPLASPSRLPPPNPRRRRRWPTTWSGARSG